MDASQAVRSLSAIAQETRLHVFRALVQAGPAGLAAGQLAALAQVTPSALSFHLKELANAGLVSARHEGRFMIYSAQIGAMNDLLAYLTENCCGGNPCSPVTGCSPAPATVKPR